MSRPSEEEEKFFKEQELRWKKEREREEMAKRIADEAERLKQLHWMHCPKCGQELQSTEHLGVTVDICNHCEGVWFDKGELDQMIELEIAQRDDFFHRIKRLFSGKQ